MNKYRKEYCKENGSVKINPENTKLYDYIKHLENKLEQAEQLTLTDVVVPKGTLSNLDEAIKKAKPNMDKIKDVDKHLDSIR
tara:strand:+ start:41 stop:286 length:246 start_codon:yes stop_codon:yes gene_type:complete